LEGKKHIFIKKSNGFTLKTKDFSYTEFIKPQDNLTLSTMLYDHRATKNENENIAHLKAYKKTVFELKLILHSKYHKNIVGF
jgi:hypothetical protein